MTESTTQNKEQTLLRPGAHQPGAVPSFALTWTDSLVKGTWALKCR